MRGKRQRFRIACIFSLNIFLIIFYGCFLDKERGRGLKKHSQWEKTFLIRRSGDSSPLHTFRKIEEHEVDTLPLAITPREHPRIGNCAKGSISISSTSNGFLVEGRELPKEGKYHKIMDVQKQRRTNFATDELVSAIIRAAKNVGEKYKGTILYVGNLSKGGGGNIKWSSSHNSGRDADIAFYLLDKNGKQVELNDFIKLNRDGYSIDPPFEYRFDVKRNWELVKSFLYDREIEVQWIFIYSPFKKKLLEYAKKIKEPSSIIAKAEEVLHQPSDSFPHNDHMHLRIYCSKDDILDGCIDTTHPNAKRSYKKDFSNLVEKRKKELFKFLKSKSPFLKKDAIYILSLLRAWEYLPYVYKMLSHTSVEVRKQVIKFISDSGEIYKYSRALISTLEKEENAEVIAEIIQALRKLEPQKFVSLLKSFLLDKRRIIIVDNFYREEWTVGEKITEIFGKSRSKNAVSHLIWALSKVNEKEERIAIHNALKMLTNQDVLEGKNLKEVEEEISFLWEKWWEKNKRFPRKKWILDGFRKQGYEITKFDKNSLLELLKALKENNHLAYNANIILSIITKKKHNFNFLISEVNYNYWLKWVAGFF